MGPHLSLPTMGGCETDAVLLVVATRTATAVSRIACLRSATTLRLSGEFPTAAWPAQATA